MSASLVGSEMCIRDSQGTPGGTWCSSSCKHELLTSSGGSSGRRGSSRPVSYTHLTLPTICSV
eukprot:3001889-Alexandrium_andersonii.AAC.1